MLDGFRFQHPIEVRFADLDALRHVNNAVFLSYMESARIAYWLAVTQRSGLGALDMILARTEIDYRSPVSFGESLVVGVRCASIKRSSLVMEFRVLERAAGRLVAEARKTLVYYDFKAGKSLALPAEIRRQLKTQDPDLTEEGPREVIS
jgi:acyl-CoA thioester hydrolase